MNLTKEDICKLFNCTMQQLNNQYSENAKVLDGMRKKSVETGKKVNQCTAGQLTEMTKKYKKLAK